MQATLLWIIFPYLGYFEAFWFIRKKWEGNICVYYYLCAYGQQIKIMLLGSMLGYRWSDIDEKAAVFESFRFLSCILLIYSAALSSISLSQIAYDDLPFSGSIKQEYCFGLFSGSWDLWLLGNSGTIEAFTEGTLAVAGTQSMGGCLKVVPRLILARERVDNFMMFATNIMDFLQRDFFLWLVSLVMARADNDELLNYFQEHRWT